MRKKAKKRNRNLKNEIELTTNSIYIKFSERQTWDAAIDQRPYFVTHPAN